MRRIAATILLLANAGCAPFYVWGDADGIKSRLVEIVPLGSSPARLQEAAEERGWLIDVQNTRNRPRGSETHMHDVHGHLDCRSRGGLVVPIIVARYSPVFETTVESLWLFGPEKQLRAVCVRKTVDAL